MLFDWMAPRRGVSLGWRGARAQGFSSCLPCVLLPVYSKSHSPLSPSSLPKSLVRKNIKLNRRTLSPVIGSSRGADVLFVHAAIIPKRVKKTKQPQHFKRACGRRGTPRCTRAPACSSSSLATCSSPAVSGTQPACCTPGRCRGSRRSRSRPRRCRRS
jgi:hypothetical protein